MTPCIEWTKAKDSAGYGVSWLNGKWIRAHRKIYLLEVGSIPEGLVVRHTCDNRCCINSEHLVLGTHANNSQDMVDRNRQARGSRIGNAKLTEALVESIRSLQGSVPSRAVAKTYNISKTNVLDIWNYRTWKNNNG